MKAGIFNSSNHYCDRDLQKAKGEMRHCCAEGCSSYQQQLVCLLIAADLFRFHDRLIQVSSDPVRPLMPLVSLFSCVATDFRSRAVVLRDRNKPGFLQAHFVLKKYPLDALNGLSPSDRQRYSAGQTSMLPWQLCLQDPS